MQEESCCGSVAPAPPSTPHVLQLWRLPLCVCVCVGVTLLFVSPPAERAVLAAVISMTLLSSENRGFPVSALPSSILCIATQFLTELASGDKRSAGMPPRFPTICSAAFVCGNRKEARMTCC